MASLQSFDLGRSPPCPHKPADISVSNSDACTTGIPNPDRVHCIVCGYATESGLKSCRIVPAFNRTLWTSLEPCSVPPQAKSVENEPRHGVLMCENHRLAFEACEFHIRYDLESRRFVLVNHSGTPDLAQFHGRAVDFQADRLCTLAHESPVKGQFPLSDNPNMTLPPLCQEWIVAGDNDDDNGNSIGDSHILPPSTSTLHSSTTSCIHPIRSRLPWNPNTYLKHVGTSISSSPPEASASSEPFSDPSELERLRQTFTRQPSWKSAVMDGETWDGTTEENVAKYNSSFYSASPASTPTTPVPPPTPISAPGSPAP